MPIKHSTYFEDRVQSLASSRLGASFSVGVLLKGPYSFSTDSAERMTVTSGEIILRVGEASEATWRHYPRGTSFEIPAKSSFDIIIHGSTSYLCEYL